MLGVVGSSLKMVKFEPTTPNMSQHFATGWPNARNILHPTMLPYVAVAIVWPGLKKWLQIKMFKPNVFAGCLPSSVYIYRIYIYLL